MSVEPARARDRPYLSVILTGRNDGFGGDFDTRLFRALEFNHRQLAVRRIPHEFVFVEWRPLPDRPLLAEVLADRFPELVPDALTSFVADASYHDACSLNPRLQFQEFIAKNVGIRRARGEFVLTTNSDIYLGRGIVDWLQEAALQHGVLYRATRVDLKDSLDPDGMDWSVLEDERNYGAVNRILPPYYTNASGDFLLADRETWLRLGGFNEVYRLAKVHLDANFCRKAHASGVRLTALDAPVYHMGSGTWNAQRQLYAAQPSAAPWGHTTRARWKWHVSYENDPGWGLWRAPTRTLRPGLHFLVFTWDAVPPRVALQGVVALRATR